MLVLMLENLRRLLREVLKKENVPIQLIRKWCRLVEGYIAYDAGLNIVQADALVSIDLIVLIAPQ